MAFTDTEIRLDYNEQVEDHATDLRHAMFRLEDWHYRGWKHAKYSRFTIFAIKQRRRPLIGGGLLNPAGIVLSALRDGRQLKSLRALLGVSSDSLYRILRDMRKAGLVVRNRRGGWQVVESQIQEAESATPCLPLGIDANTWQDYNPQPRTRVSRKQKTERRPKLRCAA